MSQNPYAAPRTNVNPVEEAQEYGEIKIFSTRGRLGRVRYIGYSMGLAMLIVVALLILLGITAAFSPEAALLLSIVGYVAILVVQFVLTIQRAHDMNTTGWLSLLLFVPLAPFVFWIIPGTPGENRYGKPPPPNTTGAILLACLPVPLVFVLGILAAIAIPAYQDYTIRAQVSEGLNLAAVPRAAVTETFLTTRSVPADRSPAGLPTDGADTSGKYVESVDVVAGTLVVAYGGEANQLIAGRLLGLQPYLAADGSIVWRCGHAARPAGAEPLDESAPTAAEVTEIAPQYLPTACRP